MSQISGYTKQRRLYIGCAGWSVNSLTPPSDVEGASQLEKYSAIFRSVEINSSFHRAHRRSTYERWAATVPEAFRFSVKAPKTITHEQRLADCEPLLNRFLDEVNGLGEKLGAILVQLPPALELDPAVARPFFELLRQRFAGDVFVEPRHKTWFSPAATRMMYELRLGRAAADPAVVPTAAEPGGISGRVYFRLHGSPQTYMSSYTSSFLDGLAFRLRMHARAGDTVWCMFDNTIRGAAAPNALCVARKVDLGEMGSSAR
ncbi:MAG: DUF72 domain-containing protein [Gemmatimonadaceae bacterium]